MTAVSVHSFHRALSAEEAMSAKAGNYERSGAGIVLEVIVGLLTAGVGIIAFEVYHARNRASKNQQFIDLAEALLKGMQANPHGISIDYQESEIKITPYNGDIKIAFGREEKIIKNKTLTEVKENLKREIVFKIGYTNNKEAVKLALQDTDNQRSLVEEFLRSVISQDCTFYAQKTSDLVDIATGLIDETLTVDAVEKKLNDAAEKAFNQGKVIEASTHEQLEMLADNNRVTVNRTPAADSRVPQYKDDKEKRVRDFLAEILFPRKSWEVDTPSPGSRLKKVLLENETLITQFTPGSLLVATGELPENLQPVIANVTNVLRQFLVKDGTLNSLSDEDLARLDTRINQILENIKLAGILMPEISRMLTSVTTGSESENDSLQKFFTEIFKNYFDEQPVIDKRAMLASFLKNSGSKDSDVTKLSALLKGSGPYLQKVLQLVGDDAQGELKTALDELKTNLNPINEEMVQAILNDIVHNSYGRIEKIEHNKDLGAASIGQAVLAKIFWKGKEAPQEVVVKVLRPGIHLRAVRELKFFNRTAVNIPGMLKTFQGTIGQIQAEMDLTQEAKYVREAQVYDEGFGNLQAMKLVDTIRPTRNYMVLEKASGITVKFALDELERSYDPEIAGKLASGMRALATKWVEEALMKSGFYHGDLHSGNIMFDKATGMITVIDMGNAMIMSWDQRKAVSLILVAAALRRPDILLSNYEALLSDDGKKSLEDKRDKLREKINSIVKDAQLAPGQVILDVLKEARNMGLETPETITNFSRSMMMLQNAISRMNEISYENADEIDFPGIFLEVCRKNPITTARLIGSNALSLLRGMA